MIYIIMEDDFWWCLFVSPWFEVSYMASHIISIFSVICLHQGGPFYLYATILNISTKGNLVSK